MGIIQKVRTLALGTAVACVLGLVGCTSSDTLDQRCGITNGLVNGGQVLRQIISCTQLTAEETYRVNLVDAILRQDYSSWKVDDVRGKLKQWKQTATTRDQWQFLLHNPDSVAVMPTPTSDSLRQVVVTVWEGGDSFPAQYWFDFEDAQLVWSERTYILGNPDQGTVAPLTNSVAMALVGVLTTYLPHWQRTYPSGQVAAGAPESAFPAWSVVLCFQDYTLYRYTSISRYNNIPPDFQNFVDSVRAVVT